MKLKSNCTEFKKKLVILVFKLQLRISYTCYWATRVAHFVGDGAPALIKRMTDRYQRLEKVESYLYKSHTELDIITA